MFLALVFKLNTTHQNTEAASMPVAAHVYVLSIISLQAYVQRQLLNVIFLLQYAHEVICIAHVYIFCIYPGIFLYLILVSRNICSADYFLNYLFIKKLS